MPPATLSPSLATWQWQARSHAFHTLTHIMSTQTGIMHQTGRRASLRALLCQVPCMLLGSEVGVDALRSLLLPPLASILACCRPAKKAPFSSCSVLSTSQQAWMQHGDSAVAFWHVHHEEIISCGSCRGSLHVGVLQGKCLIVLGIVWIEQVDQLDPLLLRPPRGPQRPCQPGQR